MSTRQVHGGSAGNGRSSARPFGLGRAHRSSVLIERICKVRRWNKRSSSNGAGALFLNETYRARATQTHPATQKRRVQTKTFGSTTTTLDARTFRSIRSNSSHHRESASLERSTPTKRTQRKTTRPQQKTSSPKRWMRERFNRFFQTHHHRQSASLERSIPTK